MPRIPSVSNTGCPHEIFVAHSSTIANPPLLTRVFNGFVFLVFLHPGSKESQYKLHSKNNKGPILAQYPIKYINFIEKIHPKIYLRIQHIFALVQLHLLIITLLYFIFLNLSLKYFILLLLKNLSMFLTWLSYIINCKHMRCAKL